MRFLRIVLLLALGFIILAWEASELRAEDSCRVVNLDIKPSNNLQIVIWLEDAEGTFLETIFITRTTGSYGLGNRPGIMEFNSSRDMCYGRRITTFPVWAHRHGLSWPQVVFQDEDDRDLSHNLSQSSLEQVYCRPMEPNEPLWDAQSCATTVYTDKGKFAEEVNLYPPRNDIEFRTGRDHEDVKTMITMNPFDAVSRPTPMGESQHQVIWSIPEGFSSGEYVVWVEVNKEFDSNASYDYPSPVGIPWSTYGKKYRGQPSVIYRLPFQIGENESAVYALDYAGYGDPDGIDGEIRNPDNTIREGTMGSGAGRLLIGVDGEQMYRVKVEASSSNDLIAPGVVSALEAVRIDSDAVALQFLAPGDDGMQAGKINAYEVRYLAGAVLNDKNWNKGTVVSVNLIPLEAGEMQSFFVDGLLPNTNYSFGVRASDECLNVGLVTSVSVLTPRPAAQRVDACFIATAAFGSVMANEVVALRSFRDRYLRTHATGELLVESYYTFGPALAKLIQFSPLLRKTARVAIGPLVEEAKSLLK